MFTDNGDLLGRLTGGVRTGGYLFYFFPVVGYTLSYCEVLVCAIY